MEQRIVYVLYDASFALCFNAEEGVFVPVLCAAFVERDFEEDAAWA